MRLYLLLLVLVLTLVKGSPLNGQSHREETRQRASEEVRSIVSAIVDAILDGDRKRRSEVVDFQDNKSTEEKQKTQSEFQDRKARTLTKRDEREMDDNSLPLANVMAISDVNSTANQDQTEISKKDEIGHASNERTSQEDNSDEDAKITESYTSNGSKSPEITNQDEVTEPKFLYGTLNPEKPSGKNTKDKRNDTKKSKQTTKLKMASSSVELRKKSKLNETKKIKSSNVGLPGNKSGGNLTAADTYAEFLQLSTPSIEKHSSVKHDPELNEDSEQYQGLQEQSVETDSSNEDGMEYSNDESASIESGDHADDNEDKMMNSYDKNDSEISSDNEKNSTGTTMKDQASIKQGDIIDSPGYEQSQEDTMGFGKDSNGIEDDDMNSDQHEDNIGSGKDFEGSQNFSKNYGDDLGSVDAEESQDDSNGSGEDILESGKDSSEVSKEHDRQSDRKLGSTENLKGFEEDFEDSKENSSGFTDDATNSSAENEYPELETTTEYNKKLVDESAVSSQDGGKSLSDQDFARKKNSKSNTIGINAGSGSTSGDGSGSDLNSLDNFSSTVNNEFGFSKESDRAEQIEDSSNNQHKLASEGSGDSNIEKAKPASNDNSKEFNMEQKDNNEVTDNQKQVENDRKNFSSEDEQSEETRNDEKNGKELGIETSEKGKKKPLGKNIKTSHRFKDEDSEDDDLSQGNEIWTSNSNNEQLLKDDMLDLSGNNNIFTFDQGMNSQPGYTTYPVSNTAAAGNNIYEDTYNGYTPELKQYDDMQARHPGWLSNSEQAELQSIQDKQDEYQTASWNGKSLTTQYLENGLSSSQGSYQTTEQPRQQKRTSIPGIKMQSIPQNGGKLSIQNNPKTNSRMIQSKQYLSQEALTDNDVYGYTGSIGPFLQKRNFVQNTSGEDSEKTSNEFPFENLVTDVKEPWIKQFLTKTLRMAVNGDKDLLTSERDGKQPDQDNSNTPETRSNVVDELDSAPNLSSDDKTRDDMPLDATNDKNDDAAANYEQDQQLKKLANPQEKSQDLTERQAIHEDIPGIDAAFAPKLERIPLSEVLKHVPGQQSPVADIGSIPSEGDGSSKSVIRVTTRIPNTQGVLEHGEIPTSPAVSATPQLPPIQSPEQPDISSSETPSDMVLPPTELTENNPTATILQNQPANPSLPLAPAPDLTSSTPPAPPQEQQIKTSPQITTPQDANSSQPTASIPDVTSSTSVAPSVVGPIIKVIAASGKKVTVKVNYPAKTQGTNQEVRKIQSEINDVLNNSIQNIRISSSNDVLENAIKEAKLQHELKEAIPVNQRRPVGVEEDIRQGLEDLKDYAITLSLAAGLSQAQRDDVAEKLARDLLDDMRVMDEKKEKLLKELMSFVTAMEISTVKERLNEIKSQVLATSVQNPDDVTTIRSTAIRLLDDLFEQLPLPKNEVKETEKRVEHSKLLQSLVQAGEKRALRDKLKKALVDLVADKLL